VNPVGARQVLLLYRPGSAEVRDPELVHALECVKGDAELGAWFNQHCAYQAALTRKFRQIAVPPDLKARILARSKVVRLPVWRRTPMWLALAAMLMLFLGLAAFWPNPRTPDRFADYQARMVRSALRQYRMDLITNDMQQVRQFMADHRAPSDYRLTRGLEQLRLTGGGLLKWRSRPVAMVCFNRGDDQMLYLFVMDQSAVKDPPPLTPALSKVNKLLAASWSQGDKTYVLAGPEEPDFVRKYL
jgi:hypothetical protein